MPDLQDGESAEVQGSARLPYILKNVGGVYSCTCPAWRNQSLGIEQRTCKHLRHLRGEDAERERLGHAAPLPTDPVSAKPKPAVPALLLAETWDGEKDVTGWFLSEKLDGVRAYWDGRQFISRQGNLYHAPAWFTADLPNTPLDGELWLVRKAFQRTVSIVRRQDGSDHWKNIRYVVFDAPAYDGPFELRIKHCQNQFRRHPAPFATVLPQFECRGFDHVQLQLEYVLQQGGEGLMLRQPGSRYEAGRSATLLKAKQFYDAEARVVEHLPGAGRHKGRLGALAVVLPDGIQFSVGSGFSDAQRERPPAVGSLITFRYQELTDRGVPRFPTFLRVRNDVEPAASPATIYKANSNPTGKDESMTRRFEFVGGTSAKFWQVSVCGADVTVCYGRIGTQGQTQTKSLASDAAAERHAEKLIAEKTGKGYQETAAI